MFFLVWKVLRKNVCFDFYSLNKVKSNQLSISFFYNILCIAVYFSHLIVQLYSFHVWEWWNLNLLMDTLLGFVVIKIDAISIEYFWDEMLFTISMTPSLTIMWNHWKNPVNIFSSFFSWLRETFFLFVRSIQNSKF